VLSKYYSAVTNSLIISVLLVTRVCDCCTQRTSAATGGRLVGVWTTAYRAHRSSGTRQSVTSVPTTTTYRWWHTVRGWLVPTHPTCRRASQLVSRSVVASRGPGMTSHATLTPASSVKSTS